MPNRSAVEERVNSESIKCSDKRISVILRMIVTALMVERLRGETYGLRKRRMVVILFDNERNAAFGLGGLTDAPIEGFKSAYGMNEAAERKMFAYDNRPIGAVIYAISRTYLRAEMGHIGILAYIAFSGAMLAVGRPARHYARLLASVLVALDNHDWVYACGKGVLSVFGTIANFVIADKYLTINGFCALLIAPNQNIHTIRIYKNIQGVTHVTAETIL